MRILLQHTVTALDVKDYKTVGAFLSGKLGLSRREISRAKFRPDGILLDGVRVTVAALLRPGQNLQVCPETEQGSSIPETPGIPDILAETKDYLVVNKPAGLLTHPVGRHLHDTVAGQIAAYDRQKGVCVPFRPIGRLDRETSGLLLVARNQPAAARLTAARKAGRLYRVYYAVVTGKMECSAGEIALALSRDPRRPCRMCPDPHGKPALTAWRVLAVSQGYSLLQITIATGRQNQIRVHMSAIRHPLLGDTRYGGNTDCIDRTALHAGVLIFPAPFTDQQMIYQLPLPEDIAALFPDYKYSNEVLL